VTHVTENTGATTMQQQKPIARELLEKLPKDPNAGDLGQPDSTLTVSESNGMLKMTDGDTYIMAKEPFFANAENCR